MKIAKRLFFVIVLFVLSVVGRANALEASINNEEITLRLKIGMITEAEFPEKIANVTKSVSSEILQVETLGNKMFLLPRENFDSRLYVVTQDNESFCLHLIMDEIPAPTRIKIKRSSEGVNDEQDKKTVNTVELMKSLLSGKMPQGTVHSKMEDQEIFNNGKFRIAIDEVYELPGNVKALCLTFENLTHKPIVIPIEHIEFPGLLAVSVDSQILEASPHNSNNKDSAGYTSKAYMIVEGQR